MHFSCKISNAVIGYLESQGEDLSRLYEPSFPPMEVLRDPSAWMSAPDMELFLSSVLRQPWGEKNPLLIEAGHAGPQTRAWGVLDSVLRMMPRPQEIFQQPERFLSYFIAPEPPIENLQRDDRSVSFDLPLPAEQYPLVTGYLKAAFESLPVYVGQPLAQCGWEGIRLRVEWPEGQRTMFAEDPGRQVSPDLLRRVIADHQRLQRELEEKNLELQRKDLDLQNARADFEKISGGKPLVAEASLSDLAFDDQVSGHELLQNMARLHDYMVRAQQLITLLAGMTKKEGAVKELWRRLDWDHVKVLYPKTIAESVLMVRALQSQQRANSAENVAAQDSKQEIKNV